MKGRISIVTLGVRDLEVSRAFAEALAAGGVRVKEPQATDWRGH